MSTHAIEIIEISKILPHPNADKMSITNVWGWQCCIGKDQFQVGDKAIYIPPDFVCTDLTIPELAFLKRKPEQVEARVKVAKLRGQLSQGLIITVPESLKHLPVGTNVIDELKIQRYEVPVPATTSGCFISPPRGLFLPKFDLENYHRYDYIIKDDEEVIITEKLNGTNFRICVAKNDSDELQFFAGTRNNWIKEDDVNVYWRCINQHPQLRAWAEANPEFILYGENYGMVGGMKYGAKQNELFFAAFAIYNPKENQWLDFDELQESVNKFNIQTAPVLYRGPFNKQILLDLAEKDSVIKGANHLSEGCVVVPIKERTHQEIGRVALKCVSNRYLEKN